MSLDLILSPPTDIELWVILFYVAVVLASAMANRASNMWRSTMSIAARKASICHSTACKMMVTSPCTEPPPQLRTMPIEGTVHPIH